MSKPLREIARFPDPHPGRKDSPEDDIEIGAEVISGSGKSSCQPDKEKKTTKSKTEVDTIPVLNEKQFKTLVAVFEAEKERLTKKQHTIRLPEELGGTFPDFNSTVDQRWQTAKELVHFIHDIRRADVNRKVDVVKRTIKGFSQ